MTCFSNGSGKDDSRRRLRPQPAPLPHGQRKHALQLDQTAKRSPAGKGRFSTILFDSNYERIKFHSAVLNVPIGTRKPLLQRARHHQEAHRRLPQQEEAAPLQLAGMKEWFTSRPDFSSRLKVIELIMIAELGRIRIPLQPVSRCRRQGLQVLQPGAHRRLREEDLRRV